MNLRSASLALLLMLTAAGAAAQPMGGSGSIHDHSTTAKGGSTIAPKTLNMPATSTATFSGRVRITGSGLLPTRQVFTSGSGVYYSTASTGYTPRRLLVRMVAAGGGSGGRSGTSCSPAAGAGGASVFGSTTAVGGFPGASSQGAGSMQDGGAGGTSGAGIVAGVLRIKGGGGEGYPDTLGGVSAIGGSSYFGGAGHGVNIHAGANNGVPGATNSGGGASGGGTVDYGGSGGGAGEYVEWLISSPAASYSYSVGPGGVAAVCGAGDGALGGSGLIIVEEYY